MVKVIIIAAIVIFVIYTATKGKKGGSSSAGAPANKPAPSLPKATIENGRVMINGIDYTKDFHRNHAYFKEIIARNFAEYTLRENVPMTEIDAEASKFFKPLDFLLVKDGQPVLAIAIAKDKASKKTPIVCRKHNVKYVTMYYVYENKESFVTDRIKNALL